MIIAGVVGIIFARSSEMLLLLSVASFIIGLIIRSKLVGSLRPSAVQVSRSANLVLSCSTTRGRPCSLALQGAFRSCAPDSTLSCETHRFEVLRAALRTSNIALDSVEEREQIVLTAGRGIIYCQLYEFGADLYVGWQSFLNRGRWIESPVSSGVDRATGKRVEVKTVVPGTQALSEYDVMDLNCLTEWTHAQLVSLPRQLMKELQIDQEIDFKIIRGERSALNEQTATAPEKKKRGAFKRTA